jgi:hypothetical protein
MLPLNVLLVEVAENQRLFLSSLHIKKSQLTIFFISKTKIHLAGLSAQPISSFDARLYVRYYA